LLPGRQVVVQLVRKSSDLDSTLPRATQRKRLMLDTVLYVLLIILVLLVIVALIRRFL
jgi:hypothetical protein